MKIGTKVEAIGMALHWSGLQGPRRDGNVVDMKLLNEVNIVHNRLRAVDEVYRFSIEPAEFFESNCKDCPYLTDEIIDFTGNRPKGWESNERIIGCNYKLPLDTTKGYCYPENVTRDSMSHDPVKALRMRKIAMIINNFFYGPGANPFAGALRQQEFISRIRVEGPQIVDDMQEDMWR